MKKNSKNNNEIEKCASQQILRDRLVFCNFISTALKCVFVFIVFRVFSRCSAAAIVLLVLLQCSSLACFYWNQFQPLSRVAVVSDSDWMLQHFQQIVSAWLVSDAVCFRFGCACVQELLWSVHLQRTYNFPLALIFSPYFPFFDPICLTSPFTPKIWPCTWISNFGGLRWTHFCSLCQSNLTELVRAVRSN